jgi:hypothetical protein
MRHASDKICIEKPNTYFMFNNLISENQAIYEIMLKNMLQPGGPHQQYNVAQKICDFLAG